jgi:hypothetical protein
MYRRPTESRNQPFWTAPSGMSSLPFLELFFFSFLAHGLSSRFSVRLNGRSLLEPFSERSVRQKKKSRRN